VYRGSQWPNLVGMYLFSDSCSGTIWGLKKQDLHLVRQVLLRTSFSITTFGEDQSGELYFADYGSGIVYQITAPDSSSAPQGCSYSIDPGGQALTSNGGTITLTVSTRPGCTWSAATDLTWVSV